MKIITIGDIHGRDAWNTISVEKYDRVIFLGDYTDSHVYPDSQIYQNLKDIITLKHRYPEKVVLLLGNHDIQYMHFPLYGCSGFRASMQPELSTLFNQNKDYFQLAHQENQHLFTHAGISGQWFANFSKAAGKAGTALKPDEPGRLAEALNQLHYHPRLQPYLFQVSHFRGGTDKYGGIVWADRRETQKDYLPGFHHIVGHTPVPEITTVGDELSSITYTDVLQTRTAFYEQVLP